MDRLLFAEITIAVPCFLFIVIIAPGIVWFSVISAVIVMPSNNIRIFRISNKLVTDFDGPEPFPSYCTSGFYDLIKI